MKLCWNKILMTALLAINTNRNPLCLPEPLGIYPLFILLLPQFIKLFTVLLIWYQNLDCRLFDQPNGNKYPFTYISAAPAASYAHNFKSDMRILHDSSNPPLYPFAKRYTAKG